MFDTVWPQHCSMNTAQSRLLWWLEGPRCLDKLVACRPATQVNTVKGPWRLLDALATAPLSEETPISSTPAAAAAVPKTPPSSQPAGTESHLAAVEEAANNAAGGSNAPRLSAEAVRRIVRDAAAETVGNDAFEGGSLHTSSLPPCFGVQ